MQYVVRRCLPEKDGKKAKSKAPKIQRLVTPVVLQRKRARFALKKKRVTKKREAHAEYMQLLAKRMRKLRSARLSVSGQTLRAEETQSENQRPPRSKTYVHAEYMQLLAKRMKEAKERKAERKRSNSKSRGDSVRESTPKKREAHA